MLCFRNEYSDEVRNKRVKRAHYKDFAGASQPLRGWMGKEDEETIMPGKETAEPEFVAFVGIDWADQKHVWSLQRAEAGELEHSRKQSRPGWGNCVDDSDMVRSRWPWSR